MSDTICNYQLGKPRIIVLANSQVFSELLKSCILTWFQNPEVILFEDGDKAWAELVENAPDLLMTDQIHAGMNGEALVEQLAVWQARFPILLLSPDMAPNEKLCQDLKLIPQPKPLNRYNLWQILNELIGPCDCSPHHANADTRSTTSEVHQPTSCVCQ